MNAPEDLAARARSRPPRLLHNVVASLAGRAWVGVMGLAFLPLYVRFLGIESYALIGVFASLNAFLSMLDLGLSSTLSRELARLSASETPQAAQESRDLLLTLETIFWIVGLLIGAALVGSAATLARYGLGPSAIPERTLTSAFAIMGLLVAVQWPASVFEGTLTGLQRQVPLNAIRSAFAVLQHGGAVLVVWLFSPTIVAYFAWQIGVNAAQTLVLRRFAWGSLRRTGVRSRFEWPLLRRNLSFAAGMTGISVLSIVLTQADKVILAKLLPLKTFGYYVLALNLSNILPQVVSPMFAAVFPRFTQLLAAPQRGDEEPSVLYHRACQTVAVLLLPLALVMIAFPREVLLLWTRDPVVASNSAVLAQILVIGTALNALMLIPLVVQLASGWTRLVLAQNTVNVILLVPLIVLLVQRHGAIGGAAVWVLLNAGYVVVMIPLMHRRLLQGEMWRWYVNDVGAPLAAAGVVVGIARALTPAEAGSPALLAFLAATGAAALTGAVVATPFPRSWVQRHAVALLSRAPVR
jgi:O-antigen/teichoic acid export membrane protein